MTLAERIELEGQKKLLAIDGGGIRGLLALEVLQRIEDLLKAKSGRTDFRLADYFDYIAGTSTGGIVAAGLSIGMSVAEILTFYREAGAQMFVKANLLQRLRFKFEDEPLAAKLREVFGASSTLGSERLRTLLLLVMRNATTDSPWPISNNPYARYNDTSRQDCNLDFPLWQLVRASTAAPTFFPPEVIVLKNSDRDKAKEFVFVDGGVTMYNNPAFQMFLMATLDRYWAKKPSAKWRAGADRMLIVSIGTGTSPNAQAERQAAVLLAELHGNICDYLRAARAVRCDPEQFVITTGTQQAIDIAIRVLLAPGDEVWFEDPGYRLTHALLLLAKAGLHPLSVDAQRLTRYPKCPRRSLGTSGSQTPPWRKADSNRWSHLAGAGLC